MSESTGRHGSRCNALESESSMTKPKRKQVRPVEQASITDKRFRRLVPTSVRIDLQKMVHPLVVLADLRNGSLASLTRYLAQEGGISDRAVAIELRKLISGSKYRSRYRLLVVEHPDRPKNKGGRPSEQAEETQALYGRMVASYERALVLEGQKAWLARARVTVEFKCNDTTVKRAIRSVGQARQEAQSDESRRQATAKTMELRRAALANFHKGAKNRPD